MNVLTLSIKQKYFAEILAGTKKQEFRKLTPKRFNLYARYVYEGKEYKEGEEIPGDGEIDVVPVKYDALKLLTGEYKNKRPYAIIEVKGAAIEILTDEEGEEIVCEEDGIEFLAAEIIYELGEVLETQLYNNSSVTHF